MWANFVSFTDFDGSDTAFIEGKNLIRLPCGISVAELPW